MSDRIDCAHCSASYRSGENHICPIRFAPNAAATPPLDTPDTAPIEQDFAQILTEAAEDLEMGVRERYGEPPHPAYEHKVARDLELPKQLRALIPFVSALRTRCATWEREAELSKRNVYATLQREEGLRACLAAAERERDEAVRDRDSIYDRMSAQLSTSAARNAEAEEVIEAAKRHLTSRFTPDTQTSRNLGEAIREYDTATRSLESPK